MRASPYTLILVAALAGWPAQRPPDPVKELHRKAEKQAIEKNYRDLKEAAAELADLSTQISLDVSNGGEYVISARIFERLDRVEKLAKRIREKAKGASAALPKIE